MRHLKELSVEQLNVLIDAVEGLHDAEYYPEREAEKMSAEMETKYAELYRRKAQKYREARVKL